MKRFLSVILALALCLSLVFSLGVPVRAAGGVAINSTNFPDDTFRSIVENSVDPNNDGVLTNAEIALITFMNVSGQGILSLKGIEYFTALEDLDCSNNGLSALDLRSNTALKALRCHYNPIENLDLTKNTALEEVYCYYASLKSLTVGSKPALKILSFAANDVEAVDVTKCPALEVLLCGGNKIGELDLTHCPKLKYLDCNNNVLSSLDLSGCPKLLDLSCSGNELRALYLSCCPKLVSANCSRNCLQSLVLEDCRDLQMLFCSDNNLEGIWLAWNPKLVRLDCYGNLISRIDLRYCPLLSEAVESSGAIPYELNDRTTMIYQYRSADGEYIVMADQSTTMSTGVPVSSFYFPENAILQKAEDADSDQDGWLSWEEAHWVSNMDLAGYGDALTSLTGLEYFPWLTWLDVSDNALTELDLSFFPKLVTVSAGNNRISEADVTNCPALETLNINNNCLTKLDVTHNADLSVLNTALNSIAVLDISCCPLLLDVYNNGTYQGYSDPQTGTTINRWYQGSSRLSANAATTIRVEPVTEPPVITTQPTSLKALEGTAVEFSVVAQDADSYQWQFKAPGTSTWHDSGMTGAKSDTLVLEATAARSGQQYRCLVSNDYGTTASDAATLTVVYEPVIKTQPKAVSATPGETATFTVSAVGGDLKYQWQFKAPGTSTWNDSSMTGAKTATLSVPATAARNGQQYRCLVWNMAGTATSAAAKLTVLSKPVITKQPESVTVAEGVTVQFTVVATGENLSYQWQFKEFDTDKWVDSGMDDAKTPTISVRATIFRNDRQYRCIVTNDKGSVTSNVATITVKAPPAIATEPQSATTSPGKTVTFSVVARGASSYQWQFKAPGTSTWNNSSMTGAKTATLSVEATAARNGQQYRCLVKNAYGTTTSAVAKLTVLSKPAITTQPQSVKAAYGDVVKFTVKATGGSLTYQWQYKSPGSTEWKNSSMTGAKTATLKVTAEKARNGQQYRCVVKNSMGSVTSSAATLTTASIAKPVIQTQPASKTVSSGTTVKFTVEATGGSLTYQWQFKAPGTDTWYNSTMTGAKTATLTVEATAGRNGQQYRCIVKNSQGTATSSAAKLTVN